MYINNNIDKVNPSSFYNQSFRDSFLEDKRNFYRNFIEFLYDENTEPEEMKRLYSMANSMDDETKTFLKQILNYKLRENFEQK